MEKQLFCAVLSVKWVKIREREEGDLNSRDAKRHRISNPAPYRAGLSSHRLRRRADRPVLVECISIPAFTGLGYPRGGYCGDVEILFSLK